MFRPVMMGSIALCINAFAVPAGAIATPIAETVIDTGVDRSMRMTVPVRIAGQGPYAFVVDTGAERTVISRELATKLALAKGEQVSLVSVGGRSKSDTAVVPQLEMGGLVSHGIVAPVLDQAALGAHGLLGIDSLRDKNVVFDFRAQTLTVSQTQRADAKEMADVVVQGRMSGGQMLLMDAEVNGRSVVVILDTGSQITIANGALRRQLERRNILMDVRPITLMSATGEVKSAQYALLNDVRIGGVAIQQMGVAFAHSRLFTRLGLEDRPALLVGVDLLRKFGRIAVDFGNKQVRFQLPDAPGHKARTQLAAGGGGETGSARKR